MRTVKKDHEFSKTFKIFYALLHLLAIFVNSCSASWRQNSEQLAKWAFYRCEIIIRNQSVKKTRQDKTRVVLPCNIFAQILRGLEYLQ